MRKLLLLGVILASLVLSWGCASSPKSGVSLCERIMFVVPVKQVRVECISIPSDAQIYYQAYNWRRALIDQGLITIGDRETLNITVPWETKSLHIQLLATSISDYLFVHKMSRGNYITLMLVESAEDR